MSNTETDTVQTQVPLALGKTSSETRIDAPHTFSGQDCQSPPQPDSIADAAQQAPIPTSEKFSKDELQNQRVERQAAQLADHLRNRQKDLDRREAQLNAAVAQLESDLRTARMWLADQEAELTQRRLELDAREKEIIRHLQRLSAAEAVLEQQSQTKARPDATVAEDQKGTVPFSLTRKSGQSPAEEAQTASGQPTQQADAQQEVQRQGEIKRRQELETAENNLAQARAEIEKLQEQLTADRRLLNEEIHFQRRQFVVQQRQALAELEKKRQALQLRGEHVDQCRGALAQLRAELQQMHRETLEIRLATEELWVQLSGAAPPAALTRSLGRIRTRLAEQYRLANAELGQQKKELESIRGQLAEQYEKLQKQKQQFEHWMACKQEESQEQASRLLAREEELRKQQAHFEEQSRGWQIERMQYAQEIRRLQLKLSRKNAQAAGV
jgi:DNA repair exonuclease SbcCD ATPase subunit